MRAIAAICLALSSACGPPTTLDLGYIAGSDAGYVAALAAADAWNSTCGTELVNVHRGEGDISLREQEGETDGAYGETTFERPFLNAIGEKRAVSIWFMSGDDALATVAHEFGHALGLGHSDHGIMQPGHERDALDPATGYRTLLPGVITADDCSHVREQQ